MFTANTFYLAVRFKFYRRLPFPLKRFWGTATSRNRDARVGKILGGTVSPGYIFTTRAPGVPQNDIQKMYFLLPDLKTISPFPPSLNPHFKTVASESKIWINGFGILSPGRKLSHFYKSSLELLAAHAHPYADREGCRTCCDHMNFTFILDDHSDDEGKSGT